MKRLFSTGVVPATSKPMEFSAALKALGSQARSRKATSTRPDLLNHCLTLAQSRGDIDASLHASLIRGNIMPSPTTTRLVVSKLLALGTPPVEGGAGGEGGGDGKQEKQGGGVKSAVEVLCNPRHRFPGVGGVFSGLLRGTTREYGVGLVKEVLRAAKARGVGVGESGDLAVAGVAAFTRTGDFVQAVRLLQARVEEGAGKATVRRAAFALLFSLNGASKEKAPWGLSPEQLQWLSTSALPLLTSPAGKVVAGSVKEALVAATALAKSEGEKKAKEGGGKKSEGAAGGKEEAPASAPAAAKE